MEPMPKALRRLLDARHMSDTELMARADVSATMGNMGVAPNGKADSQRGRWGLRSV